VVHLPGVPLRVDADHHRDEYDHREERECEDQRQDDEG